MHDDVELIITFSERTFLYSFSPVARLKKLFIPSFSFNLTQKAPKMFVQSNLFFYMNHHTSVIIEPQFSSLLCSYFNISFFLARILFFASLVNLFIFFSINLQLLSGALLSLFSTRIHGSQRFFNFSSPINFHLQI